MFRFFDFTFVFTSQKFFRGKDGLVNGVSWGFVLGLVSVPYTAIVKMAK